MNKLIFGSAIAALSFAIPSAAPAQKFGPAIVVVVDTNRIFAECNACKAAQAQLQTQLSQIQQRAQALGQPLQTEAASIRTAAGNKPPDAALQARIQALQTKQNSAQQELAGREATFNRNRAHVAQQINTRLNPIIKQVMQAHGATLAVDTGATLAVSSGIDVTPEVLAALNKQLPSVSTTAPAQAAASSGR